MSLRQEDSRVRTQITLAGELVTDGEIIYVNGMDLAQILRAATPSTPDPKYQGKATHGEAKVRIEVWR